MTSPREPREVVHLTAEYWPYARTGGLGQAVAELADHQAAAGLTVTVVLPLYRVARDSAPPLTPVGDAFTVRVGGRDEPVRLFALTRPGARVLFVEHDGYYDRGGIYGDADGDFADNHRRFALLCAATLARLPALAGQRVVLHAHDWHAALTAVFLRTWYADREPYHAHGMVLSVHNAGFQGHYRRDLLDDLGLPPSLWSPERMEWYDQANLLKGGLTLSDMVTTVSPTHAIELRTEAGGFGLHDTFVWLRHRLVGIRNGINTVEWDAARDAHLPAHYDAHGLDGKAACKSALQQALGLPAEPRTPLFAMSARLAYQKGFDIILAGTALREAPAQFVFLGAGDPRYQAALAALAAELPHRVAARFDFTDDFEHRLLAGADFLLMPSLYEPCGLTQMRAQRYGTIPVARRVGGLADTIEDEVTGFLFDEYSPAAFDRAVWRALAHYDDPPVHTEYVRRAMARDFGWGPSADRYLEVYRRALEART